MNSSITRRWVRGSLLITILVLVAAETVFLYFTVTMNYDSVRRALESRVSTIITQLSVGDTQTEEGRGVLLRRMLEQFSEKDKFELMLVNSAGRVAVSTTGAAPVQTETPADLVAAILKIHRFPEPLPGHLGPELHHEITSKGMNPHHPAGLGAVVDNFRPISEYGGPQVQLVSNVHGLPSFHGLLGSGCSGQKLTCRGACRSFLTGSSSCWGAIRVKV